MKYVLFAGMICIVAFLGCQSTKAKDSRPISPTESVTTSAPKATDNMAKAVDKVVKAIDKEALEKQKSKKSGEGRFDVHYEVLSRGSYASVGSAIIRSDKELQFLKSLFGEKDKNISSFDFSKKAIVIASAGSFNTGGYYLELASAVLANDTLNLTFSVQSPGAFDIVTQAITHPFIVIAVEVEPQIKISMDVVGAGRNGIDSKFDGLGSSLE